MLSLVSLSSSPYFAQNSPPLEIFLSFSLYFYYRYSSAPLSSLFRDLSPIFVQRLRSTLLSINRFLPSNRLSASVCWYVQRLDQPFQTKKRLSSLDVFCVPRLTLPGSNCNYLYCVSTRWRYSSSTCSSFIHRCSWNQLSSYTLSSKDLENRN